MDIMLVGGVSPMCKKLCSKLYKEGHRIYVLSGNRNPSNNYDHVFERYDFSYSADSVKEVFRSVNPDVTVVLGAFDSNLYEHDFRREAVEYASGLQNVLLSWSALNKGRLVYLSSAEVYGSSYPFPVTEGFQPIPSGIRSMTLLQAEESCRFYQERLDKDVVILRLDRIYDIPADKNDAALGICESKCLDAFRDGTVTYKRNYTYGLTYMGDAIESIYKVISCKKHDYNLYHISSSRAFSELQIVDTVSETLKEEPEKIDNTIGEQNTVILSNKRFSEEFGFTVRQTPEEIIQKTLIFMKKHSGRFLDKNHPGLNIFQRIYYKILSILGAWFPYVENLILFIPFFMLNNRATESQYFSKIDFYLIYVLIFAVVHGQRQATFSALLATAGYIFRQMYSQSGFTVVTDYNTYVWIAEIFIVGLVVGFMKDRVNFLKEESDQEVDFLSEQVTDITDINDSNLRVKEGLITQVVNYDYSLGTVYEMIDKLGEDHPTKILFRALRLVRDVTECHDVSIYLIDGDDARLFGYTSEKAASLGHKVRLWEVEPLYEAIAKDVVYINRNMNADYPMMAYTVYEDGKPNMLIMLWSIPFERLTIDESNRLTVLCKLIRKSVKRAEEYLALMEEERTLCDGRILKEDAFDEQLYIYREANKNNVADYILIRVLNTYAQFEESENCLSETDSLEEISETVPETDTSETDTSEEISGTDSSPNLLNIVPATDYIGYSGDGDMYILLVGTDMEECNDLVSRLKEAGIETEITEETVS